MYARREPPTYTVARVRIDREYYNEDYVIYGKYKSRLQPEKLYDGEIGRLGYMRPKGTIGQRDYKRGEWYYNKLKMMGWIRDHPYEDRLEVNYVSPPDRTGRIYVSIDGDESFYLNGMPQKPLWNSEEQRIHESDWGEFMGLVKRNDEAEDKFHEYLREMLKKREAAEAARRRAEENPEERDAQRDAQGGAQGGAGESKTQLRM